MQARLSKGIILLSMIITAALAGCDNQSGSDSASGSGDPTRLGTPTNLSASDGTYTDRIVISWDSVSGADQYTLYRAETAGGNYSIVDDVQTSANPSYVEEGTVKNKHYFYKVQANSSSSRLLESELSAYDEGYSRSGAATVEDVTATDGIHDAKIGLTWKLVDGATSYKIYRSESLNGDYSEIASIAPPQDPVDPVDPVDPPVDPVDPGTVTSEFTSNVDLGSGILVNYLYTYRIRLRIGTTVDEMVEFKNFSLWNLFGKKFHQDDVIEEINTAAGFELCTASDSGEARYVKLTYNGEPVILENDTSNSPIAKFLRTGVGEEQVVIINGAGVLVIDETEYTGNPDDYITADDGTGDDGGDDGNVDPEPETSYFYEDTNVTRDLYYYYRVQAIDANGPGDLGDFDYGFCGLPPKPAAPVNVSASDGASADSIVVTWNAGIGADTYTVYRAKWQKSAQGDGYMIEPGTFQQIVSGITGESYTDTASASNVIDPGMYYYAVVSVGATGTSDMSQNDSGYRAITDTEFIALYRQTENRLLEKIKAKYGNYPLGKTTFNGDLGGTVDYSSDFNGTAKVSVIYADYVEYYFIINGTTSTVITPPSHGHTTGTLYVTGIYPGKIVLYLEVTTSGSSGGYYLVTQQEQTQSRVDWTK